MGPDGLSFNENFNTTPEGFAPSIDPGEESNDTVLAPVPGSTIRKPRTCFGVCYAVTGMDQWLAVIKETMASRIAPDIMCIRLHQEYQQITVGKEMLKTFGLQAI